MAHSSKVNNHIFKIVILGDSGVGKTSLMQRFLNKEKANKVYRPTIGCDFHNYKTQIDGTNVTLQIWDTAGQERYQSLGKAFYRGSDACILVYDITSDTSLTDLKQWIETFSLNAGVDKHKFAFFLVGNKCDLAESRQVQPKHIDSFLSATEVLKERVHETSAQTGAGIEEVFGQISRDLLDAATGNTRKSGDSKIRLDKKAMVKRKTSRGTC